MRWTDLLSEPAERTLPWMGGRAVHDRARGFRVVGELPAEHGWHRFTVGGSRRARWCGEGVVDLDFDEGRACLSGYLVEDRLVVDGARVTLDADAAMRQARPVWLTPRGLERFARARVARQRDGKLVFVREELPLGPEPEVLDAFVERRTLDGVRGVSPALHLAFLWYVRRRARTEARARAEAERAAKIALQRDAPHDAHARRRLAAVDFTGAARAALSVGGAVLLDVRDGRRADERVVQFRFAERRFECVVHARTLRVIDSGVCLIDHRTEERGDDRFTLESLVAVIDEAIRTHQLVVFRHV